MADPKIRLQKTFKSVLVIDEAQIDVCVKRMTNREFDDFAVVFMALNKTDDPPLSKEAKALAEQETRQWIRDALDAYLTIAPGQIDDAGSDITKGGDLLDLFGGRLDIVPQALGLIYGENRVSEKKKEAYRLGLGLSLGLLEATASAATGSAPATTADAAEPTSSAPDEAATDSASDASSGTAVH